jgi:Tfp pilus assembly protein PilO
VTLTDRDKKIVILLIPLVLAAAYWFMLLAPKRDEAAQVKEQLAQEETKRDEAVSKAAQLEGAKRGFSDDYATVIHLGKALPTSVDMPSLLVQLDRAARGTGIEFDKIATGDRETAPAGNASSGSSGGSGNSAAGGAPAQTGGGQAAEAANNTAEQANARNGQPSGGSSGGSGGGTSGVAGLDTVPLDFEFTGSFFDLADFFHRMKRFVRVTNERIIVRGRLLTVDSFKFTAGEDFPQLKAEIKATVYLAPRAQGTAAGATPTGPAPSSGGSGNQTASNPTTPTATATP